MEEEIVFNHTGHKALWNWLADNPDKDKIDYFMSLPSPVGTPRSYCYACEYDTVIDEKMGFWKENCSCPLIWDNPMRYCMSDDGLYYKWENCSRSDEGLKVRAQLARKIANLPVKEGIKCV